MNIDENILHNSYIKDQILKNIKELNFTFLKNKSAFNENP